MSELFRETLFGHAVQSLTGSKILLYPEERTNFELPPEYSTSEIFAGPRSDLQSLRARYPPPPGTSEEIEGQGRVDLEGAFHNFHLTKEQAHTVVPSVSKDGIILVDLYSSDDPANPQNWSSRKKAFVVM